jgi:hypothetical protein
MVQPCRCGGSVGRAGPGVARRVLVVLLARCCRWCKGGSGSGPPARGGGPSRRSHSARKRDVWRRRSAKRRVREGWWCMVSRRHAVSGCPALAALRLGSPGHRHGLSCRRSLRYRHGSLEYRHGVGGRHSRSCRFARPDSLRGQSYRHGLCRHGGPERRHGPRCRGCLGCRLGSVACGRRGDGWRRRRGTRRATRPCD